MELLSKIYTLSLLSIYLLQFCPIIANYNAPALKFRHYSDSHFVSIAKSGAVKCQNLTAEARTKFKADLCGNCVGRYSWDASFFRKGHCSPFVIPHCDYLPQIHSRNDLEDFLPEPGQYIVQGNSLMAFTYTS